jgi:hypothetical protein
MAGYTELMQTGHDNVPYADLIARPPEPYLPIGQQPQRRPNYALIAAIVCFLCGVVLTGVGLMLDIRPHVKLDVVLTQEELDDRELRERTLAALKQANGNAGEYCMRIGSTIATLSGILVLILAIRRQPASVSPLP